MENCICLICNKPNKIYLDFLSKITGYDVVVIIDDENEKYYENNKEYYDNNYPNMIITQIKFFECIEYGFQNSSITLNKMVSGWDKAIYFFFNLHNNKLAIKHKYKNVWFIEDDVFFCNEEALKNIDNKYPNSDLLVKRPYKKENDEWIWKYININMEEPYYKSLVCASRLSSTLLSYIFDYAEKYKQIFFIESLFPTIAIQNNLQCDFPDELDTIVYRKDWSYAEINKTNIYHPIKNIELHKLLREALCQNKN